MLNLFTITFYLAGATTQAVRLRSKQSFAGVLFTCCGLSAILLHSYLLYHWIDLSSGQNLTEFNLLSLATWVTAVIVIIMTINQPIAYLCLLLFPLAAASIFLASYYPSSHVLQTASNPGQLSHILLSVITFSVLLIAGVQALILAVQEKILKQKYFEFSRALPPIETMETMLFQMITAGAILLSSLIITSIYFFHQVLFNHFLHKTVLAFTAWCIFITLLICRFYLGWRGKRALYCTLGGVALLSILYLGSILMELLS